MDTFVTAVHPDIGEARLPAKALNKNLPGGLYSKGWRIKKTAKRKTTEAGQSGTDTKES